jgi:hypothetical protein
MNNLDLSNFDCELLDSWIQEGSGKIMYLKGDIAHNKRLHGKLFKKGLITIKKSLKHKNGSQVVLTPEGKKFLSSYNKKNKKSNPSKSFDWTSKENILDLAKFFHDKFPDKSIKEIGKEISDSIDENGRYSSYGNCAKVEVDGEEFNLVSSFDEFHRIALEYVTQQLQDEPELFNQDWLQNHTYITDTDKRLIAGDEAEAYTGNLDEDEIKEKYEEEYGEVLYDGNDEHILIGSYTFSYDVNGKEKYEEADKIAAEWHGGQFTELYKLSSSGMIDSKEDLEYEIEKCLKDVKKSPQNYDKGEEERLEAFLSWANDEVQESEPDHDKMKEQIYDGHYDYVYEQLEKDPMNYFVHEIGAYTEEEYLKASFVSIDIEAAAEDALSTDGEAHFLSHYDGNYEETSGGIIVMKE